MDYEEIYVVLFSNNVGEVGTEAGRFDTFGLAMACALRIIDKLKKPGSATICNGDMKILQFKMNFGDFFQPWVQIRRL